MNKMSTLETVSSTVTTPATISVSGMLIVGIPLSDWVIIGTLILILLQGFLWIIRIMNALDDRKNRNTVLDKEVTKDER